MLLEVVALYRHHAEDEPGRITHVDAPLVLTDSDRAKILESTSLGLGVVGLKVEVYSRSALLQSLMGQHLAGAEWSEHREGRAILRYRVAPQGSCPERDLPVGDVGRRIDQHDMQAATVHKPAQYCPHVPPSGQVSLRL